MEHLIPQYWFTDLPQLVLLAIVAVSIGFLGKGADWMVEGAAGMAYRFGLPKVIVGATIISLGTTSPEFAVSVMAAWGGDAGLALGNAVGSVIADTGLIFGLGCLMTTLPADKFVLSRQGWVQFGSAALLAIICYSVWITAGAEASLGRGVGIVLVGLLALYLFVSVRWSRGAQAASSEVVDDTDHEIEEAAKHSIFKLSTHVVVGLALVIVSSHILICAVKVLAERWGVPDVVVAATIVAFGTSLPELVIGITSIRKGHPEILVGNIIGADILNVLFVIGGSAVAAELPIIDPGSAIPEIFLFLHIPVMLLILILFRFFIFSATRRGSFQRWQGVPLLLIYVGFVIVQYLLGSVPTH